MSPSTHFPQPLRVEVMAHGARQVLTAPFSYVDGDLRIDVATAFETDFNSTPRLLWPWFAPWEHPEAGVIHDHTYQHPRAYFRHGDPATVPLTRAECDKIHRRILEINGCRWGKRQAAYLGLRAGGWSPWRRYREEERVRALRLALLRDKAAIKYGKRDDR